MNVLRFLVVLVVLCIWCSFIRVEKVGAETSGNITVSASPFFLTPGGCVILSIFYINDSAVELEWTLGANTTQTMIRSAVGRLPADRNDGNLVYYGTGTNFTDSAISLAGSENIYYVAFSQRADSIWISCSAGVNTEGFMSASFLFLGLVVLGCFLLWFSSKRPEYLVKLVTTLVWWGLGFWVTLGGVTNLGIGSSWTIFLLFAFFVAGIIPQIMAMNQDNKVELRRQGRGQSWTEWSARPEDEKESGYDKYKRELEASTGKRIR